MLILVDPHSGIPVYRQVMDQIKFHIASGMLKAGDELPSTRSLSSQLGVNPMTVSKSYGYLEKEGVVTRRPGRPLVVSEREPDTVKEGRLEQLRQSLGPSVTVIRQLGIGTDEALNLLGRMLSEEGERTEHKERSR